MDERLQRSDEVTVELLAILREGLLRIRARGWDGKSDECANEADHLHNLPGAIAEPSLPTVSYYYDVERPAYLQTAVKPEVFQPHWEKLREILAEAKG